jgi:Tfp pilus assembly protein PilW
MKKNILGISLIETVIVIGVFAVLGILSTATVLLSLQGSKKGDAQVKVRENLDYAISVIERQLRNAESVSPCTNTASLEVRYSDYNNISTLFSCVNVGSAGYVASGSARLTNEEINITNCSFTCSPGSDSVPPKVAIDIQAVDTANQGSKAGATVSISTEINLRTY